MWVVISLTDTHGGVTLNTSADNLNVRGLREGYECVTQSEALVHPYQVQYTTVYQYPAL